MMRKLTSKLEKIKQKCRISGISDIMVVKWNNNQYKSTPFTVCFGNSPTDPTQSKQIKIRVNNTEIPSTKFYIDEDGNLDPLIPSQKVLQSFNLKKGQNDIQFILNANQKERQKIMNCQIHFYDQNDKLLISDVDGTLTKSDFYGMVNNIIKRNHIHNGYIEFIENAQKNGYKIVWLTMRSISMYNLSKNYIKMHTKTPGPLFPWPEQILSALKKQLTKNTIDPKTFLLRNIRQIFPENVNPFAGALGNRQNDALAYTVAQVPLDKIYLVDKASIVQRWGHHEKISYDHMSDKIQHFFPKIQQPQKADSFQIQQQVEQLINFSIGSRNTSKSNSIKTADSASSQHNNLNEHLQNLQHVQHLQQMEAEQSGQQKKEKNKISRSKLNKQENQGCGGIYEEETQSRNK